MTERSTSTRDIAASILDIIPSAVILTACDRRIRYLNGAAEAVLHAQDLLHLTGGRLAATNAESHEQLKLAVELVCRDARRDFEILSLQTPQGETCLATVAAHVSSKEGRRALIIFRLRRREAIAERLNGLFGMTRAEAELALRLSDGSSLQEIAGAKGVKLSTARAQLRSVFSKLDCSRQAEIVSLVGSMVLPFDAR